MLLRGRIRVARNALRSSGANESLRFVQMARLASVTGRWAYTVTLAVYAYRSSGAGGVAVAGIVRLGPAVLAAPFAGALARRLGVPGLLGLGGLLRALALAVAGAAVLAGEAAWTVYACVALEAAVSTVLRPVQNSLLPGIARSPEELTSANLVLSVTESLGLLTGPLLGAFLLDGTSVGTVFLVAASAYVVSAGLLHQVKQVAQAPLERAEVVPERRGLITETLAGARAVAGDGDTAVVLALYGAQSLLAGTLNVLIVVAALKLLDLGQSGVGTLTAAVGVGGVLGGGVLLTRLHSRRQGVDLAVGLVLWGVPLILLAVLSSKLAAFALLGVVGIGVTVVDVAAATLVQRATHHELLAHALGFVQVVFVTAVGVGTLAAPAIVSGLGVRGALVATGIPLPLLAVVLWSRLRRLDGDADDSPWLSLLARNSIFAPLSTGRRERLARELRQVVTREGDVIVRQDEVGATYYLVEAGTFEVEIDGRPTRTLGPGDSFGEIALLRDVPRTATVRALSSGSLLELAREPFLHAVVGSRSSSDAADAVIGARLGIAVA